MVGKLSLLAISAVLFFVHVAHAKPPQKIFGGELAQPGEFPYQVSLRVNDRHICGGAIISDRHIVTAAHCVTKLTVFHNLVVVTGSITIHGAGQTHTPKAVYYHREYTQTDDGPNDIAVIALQSPITFNANQNKIALPSAPTPSNVIAIVSGWGSASLVTPGVVENLRKLTVRTISPAECQQYQSSVLYTHQICAFAAPGSGTCSGDSGGPLAANGALVGIVSYGLSVCAQGVPDVFSSVYHYTEWLNNLISTS